MVCSPTRHVVLCLLLAVAIPVEAGPRRIQAAVSDSEGKALAGVRIVVTSPLEQAFSKTLETDRLGRFALDVPQSMDRVDVRLACEGYQTVESRLRPAPDGVTRIELKMRRLEPEELLFPGPEGQQAKESFERGLAASKAEDWRSAQEAFARAVELKPGLPRIWLRLAISEYNLGHYERAIECARRARDLDRELAEAEGIVADASAMLALKRLSEPESDDSAAQAARSFSLAAELVSQGRDEEAVVLLRQALETEPDLAEAHYELGLALLRLGHRRDAGRHLARFTQLDPASPRVPAARKLLQKLSQER